eukprot:12888304-Prorocentrum_lima.AAC.1
MTDANRLRNHLPGMKKPPGAAVRDKIDERFKRKVDTILRSGSIALSTEITVLASGAQEIATGLLQFFRGYLKVECLSRQSRSIQIL